MVLPSSFFGTGKLPLSDSVWLQGPCYSSAKKMIESHDSEFSPSIIDIFCHNF